MAEYLCSCGLFKLLKNLYFCRHCAQIRCRHCIDTYYCQNCQENVSSSEVHLKQNKCANCYQCPICDNILVVKGSIKAKEDETVDVNRFLYLFCEVCFWSSKSVQMSLMKEQDILSPYIETFNGVVSNFEAKIDELMYQYQDISIKNNLNSSTYPPNTTTKTYMNEVMKNLNSSDTQPVKKQPCPQEFIPFEDEFVKKSEEPISLRSLATPIQSSRQKTDIKCVSELSPMRLQYRTKLTMRCMECDCFIIKPELKPGASYFKVEQMALYNVPDISIQQSLQEKDQIRSIIVLIRNLSQHSRNIKITNLLSGPNMSFLNGQMDQFDKDCFDATRINQELKHANEFEFIYDSNKTSLTLTLDSLSPNTDENYAYFHKINYEIYKKMKSNQLPDQTLLYQDMNCAMLKLSIRSSEQHVMMDKPKYVYGLLTFNHAQSSTLLLSSTVNESTKAKNGTSTDNGKGDEKKNDIWVNVVFRIPL